VTDEGVKALAVLKELQELDLFDCDKVTVAGVIPLTKALPKLQVRR